MIQDISQYSGFLILAVIVAGFLVTMLLLAIFLGPSNKTRTKQMPFECGVISEGLQGQRFNVRYYLVAMLFILFDIEVIFIYPWAVNLEYLGWSGLCAMFSFMAVLVGGLVYVWRKGALKWI